MYKKSLIKIITFVALISAIMINVCSHTSTPAKKPTIPEVTLPSVYDEYETETNSQGEIVVIVPSTDENGSTEYVTEIATDEAGENITVPSTTEAPTEPVTEPSKENHTTEPVTEPSGEGMTEAPTQKPTVKPTEPTTSKKEDSTTKPTSKPTQAPTTQAPTQKPTSKPTVAPTTEPQTQKPTQAPTQAPTVKPTEAPTVKPTEAPTEKPTVKPTEEPTTAPVIKDKVIKTTDADYAKYNERVAYWIKWDYPVYTTGEWVYVVHQGTIRIVQYVGNAKNVTVPTSIHNKPVTALEDVFENNATVENVIIPANNSIAIFFDVFDNSNIKTVRIGHQAALKNTQSATFNFGNGISYTPDKTVYVYLDEDFVSKAWKDGDGTISAYSNCTFVISMNDGRTAYYHGYYNITDCTLHEHHFYSFIN